MASACLPAWAQQGLTPLEAAGRRIYLEGASPSGGSITAKVGVSAFDVPATAVPCANCHGEDGLGRPEGGVVPPNIQWSELAKPYGHIHPNGRKHPAFDDTGLRKAVTQGQDPAGNELDPAMPRYTLSGEDMKALAAYLRKLEFQLAPGVTADRLRLGTVLPQSGPFGEVGRAVQGMLEAYFGLLNARGGLYGRKIELVVADYGERPEGAYAAGWKLVSEGGVFALLAPFSAGWEGELGRLAAESRIPVVAPITLFPEDTRASNLYVFHLLSGVAELAQVLGAYAADNLKLKGEALALLHAPGKPGADLAQSVAGRLVDKGWAPPAQEPFGRSAAELGALARDLQKRGVEAVLVVGPGFDLAAFAREAEAVGWKPHLLVPGPVVSRNVLELPAGFADRIFLAYPTLPTDQKPAALQEYAAMFQAQPLIRAHQTIQVPAYAAALATVEVLKRSGKDVSRAKFMSTFETLQDWDSGMTPPLSYNADRRIGALGGYVVAVDLGEKQFRPVGGFVKLSQ